MAKSVKWLRKALKNLEQTYDYVAETNIDAAIAIVLRIQAATDQLSEFPMMGRPGRGGRYARTGDCQHPLYRHLSR